MEGYSNRTNHSVSSVRLRFEAIFADTRQGLSSNSDRIRLFVIHCLSKNNENFVVRALSEVEKGEPALDRNFFHPLKFGILKTSIVRRL